MNNENWLYVYFLFVAEGSETIGSVYTLSASLRHKIQQCLGYESRLPGDPQWQGVMTRWPEVVHSTFQQSPANIACYRERLTLCSQQDYYRKAFPIAECSHKILFTNWTWLFFQVSLPLVIKTPLLRCHFDLRSPPYLWQTRGMLLLNPSIWAQSLQSLGGQFPSESVVQLTGYKEPVRMFPSPWCIIVFFMWWDLISHAKLGPLNPTAIQPRQATSTNAGLSQCRTLRLPPPSMKAMTNGLTVLSIDPKGTFDS